MRLIVCTHAHVDHCGQAPAIAERAGCEVWMHHEPRAPHATTTSRRRSSGASWSRTRAASRPTPLQRWIERRRGQGTGQAGTLRIDRELTEGDTVDTDLGAWRVIETPGHAPSHICLYQPERRLLISGDHLLGRVSLYFDTGYTPDPVAEFLDSLDKVENLDARLALSGHGRPFTDVAGHVAANRALDRSSAWPRSRRRCPGTAYEIAQSVYGERFNELDRQLAPEQDARLARPPRAARAGAACRR